MERAARGQWNEPRAAQGNEPRAAIYTPARGIDAGRR
jgi:hypothetical protein